MALIVSKLNIIMFPPFLVLFICWIYLEDNLRGNLDATGKIVVMRLKGQRFKYWNVYNTPNDGTCSQNLRICGNFSA